MTIVFDKSQELPQPFPNDPAWQENIFFSWYDDETGIGGVHRLGQWPSARIGNCWSGIVTRSGLRFRRCTLDYVLTDDDRQQGISVGPYRTRYDGHLHLRFNEPEVQGTLTFEDFHDPVRYWHAHEDLSMSREFAADHYEASGRVHGTVRIGAEEFKVEGFGHRDHSWGIRKVETLVCHRWLAGSVGPALSWSIISWLTKDGELMNRGYVVRNGVHQVASSVDIMALCEPDGITHRGGWGVLTLADGESIEIRAETVDGILFGLGPEGAATAYFGLNGICRATVNGHPAGFTNLEMSNNARQGRATPTVALRAALQDGLSIITPAAAAKLA